MRPYWARCTDRLSRSLPTLIAPSSRPGGRIAFIVANAVRLLAVAPERGHPVHLTAGVALSYVGLGLVVGNASGLFGIGGGIIAVPLLISGFAVSDLTAKGTALLVSIPASVAGTVTSRRSGLVDVRAGLIVGTAAAAASVPAVYAALVIPAALSGILFAALLLAVAVQLVINALPAQRIQAAGHRAVAQSQVSTSGDLALTPPRHQETSAPGPGADRPETARFPAIRKKEKRWALSPPPTARRSFTRTGASAGRSSSATAGR